MSEVAILFTLSPAALPSMADRLIPPTQLITTSSVMRMVVVLSLIQTILLAELPSLTVSLALGGTIYILYMYVIQPEITCTILYMYFSVQTLLFA